MPADWQLPPGVSRGMWDYFHDPAAARAYDERLAGCALLDVDQRFVLEHCQPPGRILDLGCGTGRLAVTLAGKGYRPLAVDLSAEMLQVTREKAERAGVEVECLQANLVELDSLPTEGFDHAVCLFSTLGMISGREARRRFMEHVYRLLRPGGCFVVHVHNRWFGVWTAAGRRLLWADMYGSLRGRHEPGDYLMPAHQGLGRLPMHLFTRREILHAVRDVGFRVRDVRPISLRHDGVLRFPWWLPGLRSYGYLLAATRSNNAKTG